MKNFQPVILGTDLNAYNVARAFHMAHGVTSQAFGNAELMQVKHSKIVFTTVVDGFYKDEVMVETLVNYAKSMADTELILFASGENYVFRIFSNYDVLSNYYHIPYAEPKMGIYYSDKVNFYQECEKYGIPYPKAYQVSRENSDLSQLNLTFPLILKPSESTDYFSLTFEGKEKAYILQNQAEYNKAIADVYNNGYQHDMLVQEYVAGPVTDEYVLNVYSDKKGKVRLLSLGQIVLDNPDSELRGNYLAITSPKPSQQIDQLYADVIHFLEDIKFTGLANMDFKWDETTQSFKTFDFNLRQGRSSFFSVVAGANYAISVVDDLHDVDREVIYGDRDFLWLDCTEKFIHDQYAKINPTEYAKIKDIKNVDTTITYAADNSLLRRETVKKYLKTNDKRLKASF